MARGRGNAARDSEGGMARSVSTWLMVFAPCVLVYAGPAHTQYLPSPSAAESPPVIEPNLFDPNSIGTVPLPAPNAAESPLVTDLQDNAVKKSFDPNSIGAARAQYLPPPNSPQSPPVTEPQRNAADSPFDARSVGTARAQYLPPPNPADVPIFVQRQHVAVSSSFDADSLGNRNVYVDGTFAPFSGIYESGVRFRLTGNASWYKFVTSEDPRTGGEPVTALLRGSGA
jgi:hypothetical protein